MGVRAEKPRTFYADGAIAKCGTFGGARNDTDVVGHGWRTSSSLDREMIAPTVPGLL
jgi:hypothetical protein